MQQTKRGITLATLATALTSGNVATAEAIAAQDFAWNLASTKRGTVSKRQAVQIFIRDRFIDRYAGSQLVFPGALLCLGRLMPKHFPMHPTWKAGHSHDIFWELWPVVDHVHPVSRGGANGTSNYVTTSVLNNSAKGNALLTELGWALREPTAVDDDWDGLVAWFKATVSAKPQLLEDSALKNWSEALTAAERLS